MDGNDAALFAKCFAVCAKKNRTIFDAANILGRSPKDLVGAVDELCKVSPVARKLFGHWPRLPKGHVFLKTNTITDAAGVSKQVLKHGQHVIATPVKPGFVEISSLNNDWLGVVPSRSVKSLSL